MSNQELGDPVTDTKEPTMPTQMYSGTKIVNASPMNRLDYINLRGWTVPEDEDPTDEGYLVEYTDGGKANVEGYAGYVSWSPKDVFERAYTVVNPGQVVTLQDLGSAICTWHQEVCERVQHEINIPDDVVVEVKFQDGTSRDLTPEEKIVFIEGMRHVYDHFNTLPIQAVEVPTDASV